MFSSKVGIILISVAHPFFLNPLAYFYFCIFFVAAPLYELFACDWRL
jgi:hypothetical protein